MHIVVGISLLVAIGITIYDIQKFKKETVVVDDVSYTVLDKAPEFGDMIYDPMYGVGYYLCEALYKDNDYRALCCYLKDNTLYVYGSPVKELVVVTLS